MSEALLEFQVASAVARVLAEHGALPVGLSSDGSLGPLTYAFEDPHSIIGVSAFGSAQALIGGWLQAQDAMARLVARAGGELGAKAWDTYLVLVAEEPIPKDSRVAIAEIRGNTRYARKLVISSDDALADPNRTQESNIARSLAPLLPLELPSSVSFRDPLSTLSGRLGATGVRPDDLEAVISAHRRGLPLIAELHSRLTGEGGLE